MALLNGGIQGYLKVLFFPPPPWKKGKRWGMEAPQASLPHTPPRGNRAESPRLYAPWNPALRRRRQQRCDGSDPSEGYFPLEPCFAATTATAAVPGPAWVPGRAPSR